MHAGAGSAGEASLVLQQSQQVEVKTVKIGLARFALGPNEQVSTTGGVVVQLGAALQVQIIQHIEEGVLLI